MITIQERVLGAKPPESWGVTKIRYVLRARSGFKNTGMKENNLLSLSYGRVIAKDIETSEGLVPESYENYQIVEPGNIILRLTDLQNDKKSLRQGLVEEKGIITSAYDALDILDGNYPEFFYYTLLALDLAKYYYSLGGGVRQSIKFNDFPNEWIAVPCPAEQAAIVDYIREKTGEIDRIIDCIGGAVIAKNAIATSLPALLNEKRNALIARAISKRS